jgi:hypothetical protein
MVVLLPVHVIFCVKSESVLPVEPPLPLLPLPPLAAVFVFITYRAAKMELHIVENTVMLLGQLRLLL